MKKILLLFIAFFVFSACEKNDPIAKNDPVTKKEVTEIHLEGKHLHVTDDGKIFYYDNSVETRTTIYINETQIFCDECGGEEWIITSIGNPIKATCETCDIRVIIYW